MTRVSVHGLIEALEDACPSPTYDAPVQIVSLDGRRWRIDKVAESDGRVTICILPNQ